MEQEPEINVCMLETSLISTTLNKLFQNYHIIILLLHVQVGYLNSKNL